MMHAVPSLPLLYNRKPKHTLSLSLGFSGTLDNPVIIKLDVLNTILRHCLHHHPFEIYRQPPLKLVCAHRKELDSLV